MCLRCLRHTDWLDRALVTLMDMLQGLQLHVTAIPEPARIWNCNCVSLPVCLKSGLHTLQTLMGRAAIFYADPFFWACTGVEYSVLYARSCVLGPILGQHP